MPSINDEREVMSATVFSGYVFLDATVCLELLASVILFSWIALGLLWFEVAVFLCHFSLSLGFAFLTRLVWDVGQGLVLDSNQGHKLGMMDGWMDGI